MVSSTFGVALTGALVATIGRSKIDACRLPVPAAVQDTELDREPEREFSAG